MLLLRPYYYASLFSIFTIVIVLTDPIGNKLEKHPKQVAKAALVKGYINVSYIVKKCFGEALLMSSDEQV